MKKIILFVPRSDFLTSDRVMPHLASFYLKSFLDARGYYTEVCDDPETFPMEDLKYFDLIGYSCTTPQSQGALTHCSEVKKQYPNKPTVIGGAHATFYRDELLGDSPYDYIVSGEGEFALLGILEGSITERCIELPRMSEETMNSTPIPWRSREFLERYVYHIDGVRATTAVVGRYCPMGCKFCESRKSGLILYSPERVERELLDIKYNCGFNAIMYYDDIFAINLKRVKELCKVIKPHNIYFRCFAHASTFSNEMAQILADAGCRAVCWGAESGHQKILDVVGKGTLVEDNHRMAETILNNGIKATAFCMIGLPGENMETIEATENFIASFYQHPNFSFDYSIYYPFKKTYIREHLHEYDLIVNEDHAIGYYKGKGGESECCVSTSALNSEEIVKKKMEICQKYDKAYTGFKAGLTKQTEK